MVLKKRKKSAGRKLFDGKNYDIVIQKLEEVWSIGGTDEEAAFYTGISKAALSDFLKRHKDISERKEALKEKPILKARQTIVRALEDPKDAQWYLERKKKNEFGNKTEIEHSGGISLTEALKKADESNE